MNFSRSARTGSLFVLLLLPAFAGCIEDSRVFVQGSALDSGAEDARQRDVPRDDAVDPPDEELLVTVAAGNCHACAVVQGTIYCWGSPVAGLDAFSGGCETDAQGATPIPGEQTWVSVTAGYAHTCGLDNGGDVYCWGSNEVGELGDAGAGGPSAEPVQVPLDQPAIRIASGHRSICAVLSDRSLRCWGDNFEGQMGQRDSGLPPSRLRTTPSIPVTPMGPDRWLSVSPGEGHVCGIDEYNSLYCWGRNDPAILGLGTTSRQIRFPTAVGDRYKSASANQFSSCAITLLGETRCWGWYNEDGRLGVADTEQRLGPTEVSGGVVFEQVAMGAFNGCGVTKDGELYCWGRQFFGATGLGGDQDGADVLAPTRVGTGTNWTEVAIGRFYTCARQRDQSVHCAGRDVTDPGQNSSFVFEPIALP